MAAGSARLSRRPHVSGVDVWNGHEKVHGLVGGDAFYDTPEQDEWIEIELGDAVTLDQVVLVPAIRRDGVNGFQADGFPRSFRLRAGTGADRTGKIIGEFTGASRPRSFPGGNSTRSLSSSFPRSWPSAARKTWR